MDTIQLEDILTLARQESANLYHYFIGVEHLFIALTQLSGGLTVAALQHHNISPRFVRYSLRESIGRYEDRRYWPGFPETPRAQYVLELARRYSGAQEPSERDLLLAILDENDSVVSRVLEEIGVNIASFRRTAANWSAELSPQAPEVPIHGQIDLNPEQLRVLQLMFREYGQVQIVRELTGGYSGARVLLIRPVRVDGYKDAPVVVKLDDRHAILYERRRYDLYVKSTLPTSTARLVDSPVVPDDSSIGGLKYTFVGRLDDTEPVSLREFAAQHEPEEVSALIRALFDVFGPAWWLQRKPYRFGAWREYEHVLPPALVIEVLPEDQASASAQLLTPLGAWSRNRQILPGEVVMLSGFVVQKVSGHNDVLHLAAGAQPESINRASKVEVRGLDLSKNSYFRGEMVDQIVGRVVRTRDDLLLRSVQGLEPEFDVMADRVFSGHPFIGTIPNPLGRVTQLLDRQVSGYLSTIHGDLHLGNILVGPHGDAWLIDFAWAREGHTLFDWAMLEMSLLVEMVAKYAQPGWPGAWEVAAWLASINRGEDLVLRDPSPLARALTSIKTLRDVVKPCLGVEGRWDEYHVALALTALRLMDWQSEPIDARRLAFLTAALSTAEAQHPHRTGGTGDATMTDITTDIDQTELWFDDHPGGSRDTGGV
ncbi:MAG TPA: Clp protease N-terminal domain-containing protein [Aggregatilinea sp.]|uniref:Clp protease N-terminal domain-containing protein n=1 Tax=Aggregatilinea sp. TaxID=2806333 RepID=UPI002C093399|nr:Clp protease N-terminal domain-containing protein [Aggregatilinea sp.]HML20168.1 Clp protease N-terminal domain-containing protein [Aggregatilinea sp.]